MLFGYKTQYRIYTEVKRNDSSRKNANKTESEHIPYVDSSSPIWYSGPGVKFWPGNRLF